GRRAGRPTTPFGGPPLRRYKMAVLDDSPMSRTPTSIVTGLLAALFLAGRFAYPGAAPPAMSTRYEDLLALFADWRAFQKPKVVDGVPDSRPAAMAAQRRDLAGYQRRLAGIDPSAWPIPQQVDYHVVRAEMNGLDFDHRVLQPWANNPAFYVTVFTEESDQPAREGPLALGAVELWTFAFPLTPSEAARLDAGIRTIPPLLEQAQTNLVGSGKDLWTFGAKAIRGQGQTLAELASKLTGVPGRLPADVARAREATDAFAGWLEARAPSKTGPSGIRTLSYDWYLKHVQLVPCTFAEEAALMRRELARGPGPPPALPPAGGAAHRRLPPPAPHPERGGVRPPLRRGSPRLHGVPPRTRRAHDPRRHGAGAARADRLLPPRSPRVLLRG